MTDFLQKYKTWTYKQNSKYYSEYAEWFQPYFAWNPFDDRNDRGEVTALNIPWGFIILVLLVSLSG